MNFISTKNAGKKYSLIEAVTLGLAPDGGLFMPELCIPFESSFFKDIYDLDFADLSLRVSQQLLQDSLPLKMLEDVISETITFPAPLHTLSDHLHILELFHGPSLAFKDFGAQFMARLLAKLYVPKKNKELVVLVATSGDTGSAVAAGFHKVEGIKVVILFPKNGVSAIQELQLTTYGDNVHAVEVDGSFDDCQALVKQCFNDQSLRSKIELTSANSINIGRLIPQSFYYFEGWKQLNVEQPISFSIPSGNFGNLTAGLIAKSLGLPINSLIAATNVNDIVPHYLETGNFQPRPSIKTISNAMDVGNPSNFDRMLHMFDSSTWNVEQSDLKGFRFSDQDTLYQIQSFSSRFKYFLDPHGAVATLGAEQFIPQQDDQIICLETAHPSKFLDTVNSALFNQSLSLHPKLLLLSSKEATKNSLSADFLELSSFLLDLSS